LSLHSRISILITCGALELTDHVVDGVGSEREFGAAVVESDGHFVLVGGVGYEGAVAGDHLGGSGVVG